MNRQSLHKSINVNTKNICLETKVAYNKILDEKANPFIPEIQGG